MEKDTGKRPLDDIGPDEADAWSRFAAAALAAGPADWTLAAARADELLVELRKRRNVHKVSYR